MPVSYRSDIIPDTDAIITLYKDSGLKRPTEDRERISQMYEHANLVITAWDGDKLVGIARSLTDFCFCCYMSDLGVAPDYQHQQIGKTLIRLTKEKIGPKSMLLLLSAPAALDYYPKVGFEAVPNGFIIKREI